MTFETREHVGNDICGAYDVLDDDRVFEKRRNPASDAFSGFGLLLEQPGERQVVTTQNERSRKQIDAEMGHGSDDNATLSLKRRVVLLGGKQVLKQQNYVLDSVV